MKYFLHCTARKTDQSKRSLWNSPTLPVRCAASLSLTHAIGTEIGHRLNKNEH